MSAEENNMALARRFMEARVEGDLDALDEMLTPDFVSHTKLVAGQPPGREGENGRSPNSLPPSPTAAYSSKTR
jgi:ketosteroid isomerase-like protein